MGRAPCCSKVGLHRGPWSPREDTLLTKYIEAHGEGHWRSMPKKAGLLRCGKSCRLRWMNYLRPDIKRGNIAEDEDELIIRLHSLLGNRWSLIAGRLPGRTDNEIKNYWNTHLRKRLAGGGTEEQPAPKETKRKKKQSHKAKVKNKNKNKTENVIMPVKPKPTRVTSLINLPRNDSFTTASTIVSSNQDQVLDHHVNYISWFDYNKSGVVFSVGDGTSLSDLECDQSRIIRNGAAGSDDDHSLEDIYEEYLQALFKTTDQDQTYINELDSFAESLLI